MIKAVIFDCFGVLVAGKLQPFIHAYLRHDPELLQQAHVLDDKACVGEITHFEFINELSKLAGISTKEVHAFFDQHPPNLELIELIQTELKRSFKIGMLSNASKNLLDELFSPDQIKLFDDIVLSCEVGLVKPDQKIFGLAAMRLGVETDECIFIDDLEHYCDGAERAGMRAILYRDFETFKNDLGLMLVDTPV